MHEESYRILVRSENLDMEDVYVIRVKTKPPLTSLYPSERRYSASTVGGLALVHFGLGALALLLGTLAHSLQGPILSLACLVPFTSGLIAWRKWYIDRNISIFFYSCIFSLVAAILGSVVTVFDISAATENGFLAPWRLENVFAHSGDLSHSENGPSRNNSIAEEPFNYGFKQNDSLKQDSYRPEKDYSVRRDPDANDGRKVEAFSRNEANQNQILLSQMASNKSDNVPGSTEELPAFTIESERSEGHFETLQNDRDGYNSFRNVDSDLINNQSRNMTLEFFSGNIESWSADPSTTPQTRLFLDINVLVACVLEILWSLLSVKISLRGMKNKLHESRYQTNVTPVKSIVKTGLGMKLSRDARPDILNHDGFSDGSLRSHQSSEPRLPMPESSKEFRERVERFLANQAAHRVVEGSC